jgi:hypothetical protein
METRKPIGFSPRVVATPKTFQIIAERNPTVNDYASFVEENCQE